MIFLFFLSFLFKDIACGKRSAGKALAGLKIVNRSSGEYATISELVKRNIITVIPFMWPIMAYQIIKNGETARDIYTNTIVVPDFFVHPSPPSREQKADDAKITSPKRHFNQISGGALCDLSSFKNVAAKKNLITTGFDDNPVSVKNISPEIEIAIHRKTGEDFDNVSAFIFKNSFFISIGRKVTRFDIKTKKKISETSHPDYDQLLSEAGIKKLENINLTPSFVLDENRIMWFLRGYSEESEYTAIPVIMSFTGDGGGKWAVIRSQAGSQICGTAPKKIFKTDDPEIFILKCEVDGAAAMHIDDFIYVDLFYSIDLDGRTYKYIELEKSDEFQTPAPFFLEVCDNSNMKILSDGERKSPDEKIERSFKWYPSKDFETAYMEFDGQNPQKINLVFSIHDYKTNKDLINDLKSNFCSNLLITAKRSNMVIMVDLISSHHDVIFRYWSV
jgi:hypothetical protein